MLHEQARPTTAPRSPVTPSPTRRHPAGADVRAWRGAPGRVDVPELTFVNGEVPCTRLVVVAAHPGDESLGTGGLIAAAAAAGLSVYVVLLTAGEAARPDATDDGRRALAAQRLAATERALGILAPEAPLVFLGAPDGEVARLETEVTAGLAEMIGEGRSTLVVAPWRHDGHPDRAAAGRAAAQAATRTGARFVECPLPGPDPRAPDEAVGSRMRRIDLSPQVAQRKWLAVRAHAGQVRSPGQDAADEPAASTDRQGDLGVPVELFVTEPEESTTTVAVPGGWGGQRLRQLALAALPRRRFRRALEVVASPGYRSEDLADRCDDLATVGLDEALDGGWPSGRFDLVVVSATVATDDPHALELLLVRVAGSLDADGAVVLCCRRGSRAAAGPADVPLLTIGLPPETARYEDPRVVVSVLCAPEAWPADVT